MTKLTKSDTRALWYAVDALHWQVRAMPDVVPEIPKETIEAERKLLSEARAALRKVNAIRKTT